KGYSIAELGPLEHLLGELFIRNLENVVDTSHAIAANLKGKRYIKKLVLTWDHSEDDDRDETILKREGDILEQLRPNTNLKDLDIYDFRGTRFPEWLGEECFSKLSTLCLGGARNCTMLPTLGQLQFLKELVIARFETIKAFASLQKLTISAMPQLQQLMPPTNDVKGQAFALLRELRMEDCPKLETMFPHYLLPSLSVLDTTDGQMQQLVASLPKALRIRSMRFVDHLGLYKLASGLHNLKVHGFESTLETLLKRIERKGYSIAELGPLEHFLGELFIRNLENVVDTSHAIAANLKGKRYIKKLVLTWDHSEDDDRDETILKREGDILEQLRPNTNLKDLDIYDFRGTRFPEWLGEECFSKLLYVLLQFLKELVIARFETIVTIGPEFCGNIFSSYKKAFASLQKLTISAMPQLQQLMPPTNDVKGLAFALLRELRMEDCPKLETMFPHYLLPSLSVLDTTDGQMQQLVASFPKALRIRSMRFVDHLGLYKLASGLHNLKVHGFESTLETLLKRIESVGFSDSTLQGLELSGCNEIHSIPLWRFQNLKLKIYIFTKLRSFPKGGLPSSIEDRIISECKRIESSPEGGFPSNLKELYIGGCNKLVADRRHWGLQTLPSLSFLHMASCKEVESFPEQRLLPSSLNTLWLSNFRELNSLGYKGLHHLSSLNELKLWECPKLESLPEEGLPSSLKYLEIQRCQRTLMERCKEEGEDWPKIKHIHKINISCSCIVDTINFPEVNLLRYPGTKG
ncbi:hypothetical protein Tsubulata_015431, partial [Turnera subulata]